MFDQYGKEKDIEKGNGAGMYPGQMEDPQMRWAFIRKVYSIVALQMIMTVAVASAVIFYPPIVPFITRTIPGLITYILVSVFSVIVLILMRVCLNRHPLNLILLGLFTVLFSFTVGISCAFAKGKLIFEAAILTTIVVVSLTLFTFWAAKQGYDFGFLGPILFVAMILVMVFSIIQFFFPMGKPVAMAFAFIIALILCALIVYDTDNLIKRYNYDEYAIAAAALYVDMIQLFLTLLSILEGADG